MAIEDFFNQAVTFTRRGPITQDGVGGPVIEWTEFLTAKCCLEKINADERQMYDSIGVDSTHLLWVSGLHAGKVDTTCKAVIDGAEYLIEDVDDPQGRGKHVVMVLRALVGAGAEHD